jgi:Rrf2 family nitric oxide-sensitive transcriptional repressor
MRLTAFTDFGLRTLMRLAGAPDTSFTTEALAREFAVSRHHLTKVVQALARAGFVVTRRGSGGGLRLARPASELTLGAVVRRLEAREPLVECFRNDGGSCTLAPGCALRPRLLAAREAFLAELDRTTLAACVWRPATA